MSLIATTAAGTTVTEGAWRYTKPAAIGTPWTVVDLSGVYEGGEFASIELARQFVAERTPQAASPVRYTVRPAGRTGRGRK
jgi:hypothetical protein